MGRKMIQANLPLCWWPGLATSSAGACTSSWWGRRGRWGTWWCRPSACPPPWPCSYQGQKAWLYHRLLTLGLDSCDDFIQDGEGPFPSPNQADPNRLQVFSKHSLNWESFWLWSSNWNMWFGSGACYPNLGQTTTLPWTRPTRSS